MSTVPKELPAKLADKDVMNMLHYAGYGISYWAKSWTVRKKAKTCQVIVRDFMRELPPGNNEPADCTLTFDQIRDAFNTLVTTNKLPSRTEEHDDLGFYAEFIDRTIQQAIFGERVVG
jgi:hypothetical protein